LGESGFDGTTHLAEAYRVYHLDSIQYNAYFDFYNNEISGYVEKINLKDGRQEWSGFSGPMAGTVSEFPSDIRVNDSGNLELVSLRSLEQDGMNHVNTASQATIREFDYQSGSLVAYKYLSDLSKVDTLEFLFNYNPLYHTAEGFVYAKLVSFTDNDLTILAKHFDHDFNFLYHDTIAYDAKYKYFIFDTPFAYTTGFVAYRSTSQMTSADSVEYWLDHYDADMRYRNSTDITGYIPYHGNNGLFKYNAENSLKVFSTDTISLNGRPRHTAILFFENKEVADTIVMDYKFSIYLDSMDNDWFVIDPLPNGKYLWAQLVEEQGDENILLRFHEIDLDGNVRFLKDINIVDDRVITMHNMHILDDKVILSYIAENFNGNILLNKINAKVCFLWSDLGLSSSNETAANSLPTIYPNPVNDIIRLKNVNQNARYEVYSIDGVKVKYGNTLEQIDVNTLEAGSYILQLYIEKSIYSRPFIKM
jgi:hypothetical protein